MKKILVWGFIILLLTGCLPQQIETPSDTGNTIATIVAATLTGEPQSKDQSGQTIVASVSTITPGPDNQATDSPTDSPTFTPTETPTLEPTETSTATPTPTAAATSTTSPEDPVLSLGVPSVRDNFDGVPIIYEYSNSEFSFQVVDDRFEMIGKKTNSYETWSLSWEDLTNFYLEITGSFGQDCAGKDRYGMIFRAPDTSEGYLISISCDGSYRLSSYESDDDKYTVIKSWTSSPSINSGPGAENRLGVMVKGDKITGYINGLQVFELNDSTFSHGRMGVLIKATDTAGFTVYLDQVVYWKLP